MARKQRVRVSGSHIRWARNQLGLTLEDIRILANIARAYQSQVETGLKQNVSWEKLEQWVDALKITESFALGQVPCWFQDPDGCHRLASDVGRKMREGIDPSDWARMRASQRCRHLLRLMAHDCERLTPVVLAYVLALDLTDLDALMSGDAAITLPILQAIADLTNLPESFIRYGVDNSSDDLDEYRPVLEAIRRRGISPEQLLRMLPPEDECPPPDEIW